VGKCQGPRKSALHFFASLHQERHPAHTVFDEAEVKIVRVLKEILKRHGNDLVARRLIKARKDHPK
jgi:hypothetical protein